MAMFTKDGGGGGASGLRGGETGIPCRQSGTGFHWQFGTVRSQNESKIYPDGTSVYNSSENAKDDMDSAQDSETNYGQELHEAEKAKLS